MFLAPRQLPPLPALLADIGQPRARVLSAWLGVSERSVYGWQAAGLAPRPVHLALFFESRWGRSLLNAQAVNGERWARGHVQALQREVATLQARIAYLESVGQFGSANAPLVDSSGPPLALSHLVPTLPPASTPNTPTAPAGVPATGSPVPRLRPTAI